MSVSDWRALRIVGTVLPGIACAATFTRLSIRWRRHQLGSDDAWAIVAVVSAIFMTTGAWMKTDEPGFGPLGQPIHMRIIGYYMWIVGFTCTLWASRLSLISSIIRITPYLMRSHLWAKRFACLFAVFLASLLILKVVVCEYRPAWKRIEPIRCPLTRDRGIAAYELATDCISDFILMIVPLRLLWRTASLPARPRRLLTIIFSANMLTALVSLFHAIALYDSVFHALAILSVTEASVALIVSNLGVLLTRLSKMCWSGREDAPFLTSISDLDFSFEPGPLGTLRFRKDSLTVDQCTLPRCEDHHLSPVTVDLSHSSDVERGQTGSDVLGSTVSTVRIRKAENGSAECTSPVRLIFFKTQEIEKEIQPQLPSSCMEP
ncbi:hypothetical protein K474DRAFT_1705085 [Panus rudis PR-1116 ss-1]|nr:hypothetical protein K474DRAFT_1705085 [Panus rudis PR-1116 ss-1]